MLWMLEISEGSYWHLSVMLSGRSQMWCLSTSCSMVHTTFCVTISLQVIGEWGCKGFSFKNLWWSQWAVRSGLFHRLWGAPWDPLLPCGRSGFWGFWGLQPDWLYFVCQQSALTAKQKILGVECAQALLVKRGDWSGGYSNWCPHLLWQSCSPCWLHQSSWLFPESMLIFKFNHANLWYGVESDEILAWWLTCSWHHVWMWDHIYANTALLSFFFGEVFVLRTCDCHGLCHLTFNADTTWK